jgi:hypothetical protein
LCLWCSSVPANNSYFYPLINKNTSVAGGELTYF